MPGNKKNPHIFHFSLNWNIIFFAHHSDVNTDFNITWGSFEGLLFAAEQVVQNPDNEAKQYISVL